MLQSYLLLPELSNRVELSANACHLLVPCPQSERSHTSLAAIVSQRSGHQRGRNIRGRRVERSRHATRRRRDENGDHAGAVTNGHGRGRGGVCLVRAASPGSYLIGRCRIRRRGRHGR
jgi:hypothetical protein